MGLGVLNKEVKDMNRVKLSEKSFGELNALQLLIENDVTNKQDGFHRYNHYARKKLEDIAWAITLKLQRERR